MRGIAMRYLIYAWYWIVSLRLLLLFRSKSRTTKSVVVISILGGFVSFSNVLKFSLGSFGLLGYDPFKIYAELSQKFGNVLVVNNQFANIAGRSGIMSVLKTNRDKLLREKGWPRTFKELIGFSLFIREDGPEALRIRRTLVKSLHAENLKRYQETMKKNSFKFLERMKAQQDYVSFHKNVKDYTFTTSASIFFGLNGDDDGEMEKILQLGNHFHHLTKGFTSLPIMNNLIGSYSTFGRALRSRDKIHEFLDELIKEKLAQIQLPQQSQQQQQQRASDTSDAFKNLLLTEDPVTGQTLTMEELKTQTVLLLIAGHDSTSSAIASLVFEICQSEAIYSELLREQKAAKEEDVFPFLDACIKEAIRKYPPAPGNFRVAKQDFQLDEKTLIREGTTVFWNVAQTNYDENTFENPFQFDPHRWLGKKNTYDEFDVPTFGAGARDCAGKSFAWLNIRTFLVTLLNHYAFELKPKQDLGVNYLPNLGFNDGLLIKIT